MLTKFETKSNRVKGLAFHPRRPWILASLHNGVIQLWDYRMGTLIDRFDEHDGPVRGVDFHNLQPLLVSGGDDYKIKVWNYKLRRCMFTLLGHLDYIRTVQFHHEYPWIVSASDDQTVRIWNWQSRSCTAVLTGHNHYVMCARFHPKEDMVVSASLDQTVRVWDISGLRKKASTAPEPIDPSAIKLPPVNSDLFGSSDAIVKYVLEGHDRGVNWASFHRNLPLIISGADDRQVKLWRMNDTKAWEVDTLRGHQNNVSCVIFHPNQDLIISNSEDKSIRIWDMSKRTGVQSFRREHDRFWILSAHPDMNLLAAGHDSGMIVFKLERERPAAAAHENTLFYVKDRYLRTYEFDTQRDVPVLSIRRPSSGSGSYRTLAYNPLEHAALLTSDAEGGSYELYHIPKDASRGGDVQESRRGLGVGAVFVARNRFAVLDKNHQILIKNFKNEVTKKLTLSEFDPDGIYYAGTGNLLLRSDDKVYMFDIQQRKTTAMVVAPMMKYVVWSADMNHVALLSKHAIVICNRKLDHLCTVHETIRVKSGAWDDSGVFIYTTLNHLKYTLPNGDSGIIRTLDVPIYVSRVAKDKIFCLDREGKNRVIQVESFEYLFKLALSHRRFDEVFRMIRNSKMCGQSIIAYLQQKGFPEVALHFVRDEKVRFNLALECGNIEVAKNSASVLNDNECWHRLGLEALRQGDTQVVEMAYQKTQNFERLSFLFLITGHTEKLAKMLEIAEIRGDIMGRFHNALYLGDAAARVKILSDSGQHALAYVTAATHGLNEEAAALAEHLGENVPALNANAQLLRAPLPLLRHDKWPTLNVSKSYLDPTLFEQGGNMDYGGVSEGVDMPAGAGGGAWEDDLDFGEDGGVAGGEDDGFGGDDLDLGGDEGGGWEDDDLDLGDIPVPVSSGAGGSEYFVAPTSGPSAVSKWITGSSLAVDHVAAGSFDTAMQILNRQIGAVKFDTLKANFQAVFTGSQATVPSCSGLPPLVTPLMRNWAELGPRGTGGLPSLPFSLPNLVNQLKVGYKAVTDGKFTDALNTFENILRAVPFVVAANHQEVNEVKELLGICREYITAMRMELQRKDEKNAPRVAELAAYFTHCNLQPIHLMLSLKSAMTISFKIGNKTHAASFARRLLELGPREDLANKCRQLIKAVEANPSNAHNVDYDERNPFSMCCASLKPIYSGSPSSRCPYCSSHFKPEFDKTLCTTCGISQVGAEATGIQLVHSAN